MTAAQTRTQVLSLFKQLHRTRRLIFKGDIQALQQARAKINSEFKERSSLTDIDEVTKAIEMGREAEMVLRTTVVQAELKDSQNDVYEVKVNTDTLRNENAKLKVGDVPGNIRDAT